MNTEILARCIAELEDDAQNMCAHNREQFIALLPLLSKLYRDDSDIRGVMVLADNEGQTLVRMNATEYEARGLLHGALPYHDELMKAAKPEQGMLN